MICCCCCSSFTSSIVPCVNRPRTRPCGIPNFSRTAPAPYRPHTLHRNSTVAFSMVPPPSSSFRRLMRGSEMRWRVSYCRSVTQYGFGVRYHSPTNDWWLGKGAVVVAVVDWLIGDDGEDDEFDSPLLFDCGSCLSFSSTRHNVNLPFRSKVKVHETDLTDVVVYDVACSFFLLCKSDADDNDKASPFSSFSAAAFGVVCCCCCCCRFIICFSGNINCKSPSPRFFFFFFFLACFFLLPLLASVVEVVEEDKEEVSKVCIFHILLLNNTFLVNLISQEP